MVAEDKNTKRILLTNVSGALVKELEVERKVKFYIKNNTFLTFKK